MAGAPDTMIQRDNQDVGMPQIHILHPTRPPGADERDLNNDDAALAGAPAL
jgi:hypothetical protein